MTGRPLSGLSVVVTRPRSQSTRLTNALEAAGAEVVSVPVIVIADPIDGGAALRAGLGALAAGEWLVLTSPNGARRVGAMIATVPLADGVKVAAIGPATAEEAVAAGLEVDLVPSRSIAEGLLEVFPDPTSGGKVLLARAETARDILPDGLEQRGWIVHDLVAYRTVAVEVDQQGREACRLASAVIFTSSSTVTSLVDSMGVGDLPALVVSIGPATSATARVLGIRVTVEAPVPTITDLVTALVDHVSTG